VRFPVAILQAGMEHSAVEMKASVGTFTRSPQVHIFYSFADTVKLNIAICGK